MLIKNEISKKDRLEILTQTANDQRRTLDRINLIKSIKKESDTTYIDTQEKDKGEASGLKIE